VNDELDDGGLRHLAAAVDEAIPATLRTRWAEHVAAGPVLVGRQGIFTPSGQVVAYELSYRSHDAATAGASAWSARQHERATAHVLSATFGRADLERVAQGRLLFVRCTRAYLVGDLPVPRRPDRLVVEIPDTVEVDGAVLAGVRRLRAEGYRIALPSFVSSAGQRRLLPHADYVKIDVRDLDLEGQPVVALARSYGASPIAEYVETPSAMNHARELGFTLFQGNLLERAGVLDRADARILAD
jgi:EAL and modified HD-GYP domain-containing signal transduction protein